MAKATYQTKAAATRAANTFERDLMSALREIDDLRQQNAKLQQEIEMKTRLATRLNETAEERYRQLADIKSSTTFHQEEVRRLKSIKSDLETSLARADNEIMSLKGQLGGMERAIVALVHPSTGGRT
jgi:chromosome segregation ATPase